jgi:enoyl-CoA hydratase/carnithine racemase
MDGFTAITYSKCDGIVYVTLNRPEVLNRYNVRMRDELYQVLAAVRDDPDVLAVIINGAGDRAFCVGADLTEFGTAPSPIIARQVRWERDVWGLMAQLEKPLIAALHGYVFGSGLELALLCDIRIASDDAVFGLPEATLGMIPAAGGTQTLPRVVGRGAALHMLITGDRIDAGEALRIGLVNAVVRREKLSPSAETIARGIAARNPIAVRYAKRAIRQGIDLAMEDGLALERRLAGVIRNSAS